ncbi:MAG: hypothetical protein ABSG63_13390 [Spirochaetia bacterium]|jgi:hypothetical protein
MKGYPFLPRLSSFAGRAVVFFFVLSLLLCFFYVLGTYQDFLDSTQLALLSLLRISLGCEIACGIWCAVFLVYRGVYERRVFPVRWVLLLLALVFCSGLLLVLRFVQSWLQS